MAKSIIDEPLGQFAELTAQYTLLREKSKYDDLSDLDDALLYHLLTSLRSFVERVAPQASAYRSQALSILNLRDPIGDRIRYLLGVASALRDDLQKGRVAPIFELVRSELFTDYLEMAEHLNSEGYKDAAAVIAGSTLESHLRQLANKFGVDPNNPDGKHKKADRINGDLTSPNAYSKVDLKNVTAWLDLRNNAAHGNYGKYTKEQVALLIMSIRDFITRNPA